MTGDTIQNDDLAVQMIGSNDICKIQSIVDYCKHSNVDGAFWNVDDDYYKQVESATIYNAAGNRYDIFASRLFTHYETEETDADHMKAGALVASINGDAVIDTWAHDIDINTPTHLNEDDTNPAYAHILQLPMVCASECSSTFEKTV